MSLPKYKLTIAYDGTNYAGWQIQKNSLSIQTLIEEALQTLLRKKIALVGAGRTDAGVHALGQTAHFSCENPLDEKKILFSLNGILPKDIRILNVEKVPSDFHARFSAKGKIYHYHIHLTHNPFKHLYSTHIFEPLHVEQMRTAAKFFIGTCDFTSFAHEAKKGSAARNPMKTIKRFDLIEEPNSIRFEIEGDGFLYKMVRNLVGTLLEVGAGKISSDSIPAILSALDRKKAGKTAPAQGLFLMKVVY